MASVVAPKKPEGPSSQTEGKFKASMSVGSLPLDEVRQGGHAGRGGMGPKLGDVQGWRA